MKYKRKYMEIFKIQYNGFVEPEKKTEVWLILKNNSHTFLLERTCTG